MNQEIVKTVKWSDAKELLSALANKNLGRAKNNKPADFNEFVTAYPTVTQKLLWPLLPKTAVCFLQRRLQRLTLSCAI